MIQASIREGSSGALLLTGASFISVVSSTANTLSARIIESALQHQQCYLHQLGKCLHSFLTPALSRMDTTDREVEIRYAHNFSML